MPITAQKIPPLNMIHAACNRLKSLPNIVHEYAEDAQATKIAAIRSIKPIKSSIHLFILLITLVNLKRFL